MQITVPPSARLVIETQDGAALTVTATAQRRRIGTGQHLFGK